MAPSKNRNDATKTGVVFNIQRYSVHDGPGIRTLVFLKGCPLQCRWCCNPESQSHEIELAYNPNKCLTFSECKRCANACPTNALQRGEDDKAQIDRNLCDKCMNCADACPAKALILYGETKSVEEVLRVVEQESIFYSRSGGGMTLSGGEPLLQAEFSLALLREAKRRRIKTAIETCGYVQLDVLEEACTLANTLLFDIKSMNSTKHRAFTGASNETILNNFREVRERFPKLSILVRTPVIPDFNDTEDDILAVLGLLKSTPNVAYELLPYHRLGIQKYAYLGREYLMDAGTVLSSETIERLRSLVG